jgi:Predicted membrane protein
VGVIGFGEYALCQSAPITFSLATRRQYFGLGTLKLVLLDLSHVGTLMRVISFMAAGFAMLLIAYIAPMPNDKVEP